jgi:hypothetical protein
MSESELKRRKVIPNIQEQFFLLPLDIISIVMKYLRLRDQISAMCVCRNWRDILYQTIRFMKICNICSGKRGLLSLNLNKLESLDVKNVAIHLSRSN